MVDSHLHTPMYKHAVGEPQAYLREARQAGLTGIVFADHSPMPGWFDPGSRMREDQLDTYIQSLEQLAADHPDFYVGIGLEADYHPGTERYVRALTRRYPFDYVIGSVHFIGAWPFDHPDHVYEYRWRDLRSVFKAYYELVAASARTGLFHAIGHADLPKKFGHLPEEGYLDLVEPVLKIMAAEGLALDVNTAGWRKPVGELYPSPAVLALARALGVGVVLGSDAHAAGEVGFRFSQARRLLLDAGYRTARFYRGGRLQAYTL